FNMDKAKVVSSPLTPNFKLTDKDFPSFKKNIEKMDRVSYASVVGSLMYAMVCTRLDLAHAVGVVSRFLSNPGKKHWEAVKWIFRYLRGTSKLGITFGNGKPTLVGYTDSDLAGNKDNMKSTFGYLMTFAGELFHGNLDCKSVWPCLQQSLSCSKRKVEDLLLVRRDGELILIDRKGGDLLGFRKTSSDHYVFFQRFGDDDFIILLLYVDDMLIVGKNIERIAQLKRDLSKSFAMKDLGPAKQIIGIRIFRDRGTSKLDITFGNGKPTLVGYTDSDLAGNKDNMKSTSGYLMTFAGGAVSWQSRLQKCVALSTTEAEYVAATEACKELLWLKRFLQELGFKQQRYASELLDFINDYGLVMFYDPICPSDSQTVVDAPDGYFSLYISLFTIEMSFKNFLKLPGNRAVTFLAKPSGVPVDVGNSSVNVAEPFPDDIGPDKLGKKRSITSFLEESLSKRKDVAASDSYKPTSKRRKQDAPKRGLLKGSIPPYFHLPFFPKRLESTPKCDEHLGSTWKKADDLDLIREKIGQKHNFSNW
nr:retrovirus-related Pol polyprotein from transposon TNT 1-94 [Tanacetum cinerariifolium]